MGWKVKTRGEYPEVKPPTPRGTGPKRTCECGVCTKCRLRENARRRAHGIIYDKLAAGRFQPKTITMPNDPGILGYLAGLLDGEGCITIQNKSWRIQIAMTHEPVIRWLGVIGGSVSTRKVYGNRKPSWRWLLMRQADVLDFLETVAPHLMVKAQEANDAIADIRARIKGRFKPKESA